MIESSILTRVRLMSILSSLYNGFNGINRMSDNMTTLADNVSNLNSVAFKSRSVTFHEMMTTYNNTNQLGSGAELASVDTNFNVGNLEGSGISTNMAIDGGGYFLMRETTITTAELYTRDGQFDIANYTGTTETNVYNIANQSGHYLQGLNLNSLATPSTDVTDVLVKSVSFPKATSAIDMAVNIEHDSNKVETTNIPLYEKWDGTKLTTTSPVTPDPLSSADYDYSSTLKIFDTVGDGFDLTIYFDHTSSNNEKEFIITCDPSLDKRLIGTTTNRYNSGATTTNKGAGALLYGVINFNVAGELEGINCWDVPADTTVDHTTATNQIQLQRGEGYYSFPFNFSGTGANQAATVNFGTTPQTQIITSQDSAKSNKLPDTLLDVGSTTLWSSVYDSSGNQVVSGDIINFTGTSGDGTAVAYSYTVDTTKAVSDLLTNLGTQFSATASVVNGQLQITDNTIGSSQLAITAITYSDANGNTPTTNTSLAQTFGAQSSSFDISPQDNFQFKEPATTSYANKSVETFIDQDGYASGRLEDIFIDSKGIIYGDYANGERIAQAQVMLANFTNQAGLKQFGNSIFQSTSDAGTRTIGAPGQSTLGKIIGSTLEMSNVDLSEQLTMLIQTQRNLQANSKSITTADEFYETALTLKR